MKQLFHKCIKLNYQNVYKIDIIYQDIKNSFTFIKGKDMINRMVIDKKIGLKIFSQIKIKKLKNIIYSWIRGIIIVIGFKMS